MRLRALLCCYCFGWLAFDLLLAKSTFADIPEAVRSGWERLEKKCKSGVVNYSASSEQSSQGVDLPGMEEYTVIQDGKILYREKKSGKVCISNSSGRFRLASQGQAGWIIQKVGVNQDDIPELVMRYTQFPPFSDVSGMNVLELRDSKEIEFSEWSNVDAGEPPCSCVVKGVAGFTRHKLYFDRDRDFAVTKSVATLSSGDFGNVEIIQELTYPPDKSEHIPVSVNRKATQSDGKVIQKYVLSNIRMTHERIPDEQFELSYYKVAYSRPSSLLQWRLLGILIVAVLAVLSVFWALKKK